MTTMSRSTFLNILLSLPVLFTERIDRITVKNKGTLRIVGDEVFIEGAEVTGALDSPLEPYTIVIAGELVECPLRRAIVAIYKAHGAVYDPEMFVHVVGCSLS